MARKLIVEIVADPRAYTAGLEKASRSTKKFETGLERTSRGMAVATVGFKGLGRSLATLSAGFIGGLAAGDAVRSVLEAGNEAVATQKQLAKQLDTSGIAFKNVKEQIDKANLSLSYISGFNADELEQSFTTLVRTTGNVNRALKLDQVAADVARGRHISLAQAAIALAKAESGNLTSLRRLGIEIPKGTSRMEALRIVAARFSGQAQAGATATDRFHAELHNTAAIIGVEVLPSFNKLLDKTAKWLAAMNSSGKTQKDASLTMRTVKTSAGFLGHSLEGLWAGYKKVAKISYAVGGGAEALTQKVIGLNNVLKLTGGYARDAGHGLEFLHGAVGEKAFKRPPGPAGLVDGGKPPAGATVAQRNTWFDALISRDITRAGYIPSLKGQIVRLGEIAKLIQARITVTKDITRRGNLEDVLLAVEDQARGLRQQRQDAAAAAVKQADDAKKAAAAIAAANKARLDALQKQIAAGQKYTASFEKLIATRQRQRRAGFQSQLFLSLGLTAAGGDRAPSRGNLLADIRKAQQAIAGSPVDSKALESKLTHLRQTLNTQFKSLTDDTKKRVAEWLDALAGKNPGGPLTPGHKSVPIADIIAGTGLQGAGLRQLEINLAGVGAKQIVVHTHVNLDGREIARNTTGHQERDRGRRPTQTRGKVQP